MGGISIGNVYGISTNKGIALIQIVECGRDKTCLDIVRVLDGFVTNMDDSSILPLVNRKELFFLRWPIVAAGNRRLNKMFKTAGVYPLPSNLKIPAVFRDIHKTKNGDIQWLTVTKDYIWDEVAIVDEAYLQLSPWEIWSIPDLIERLENGWRLSDWR